MPRDAAFGLLMLAIAVGYYWLAAAISASTLDDAVGPQGLPKIYAVILAALSLVLIFRSGFGTRDSGAGTRQSSDSGPKTGDRRPKTARIAGMLLIGVLYIVLAPMVGYTLSVALLLLATAYYQGGVINRQVVLVSASGAVFLWLLFVAFLGIAQPSGVWTSLF
jgi:putative tricarboxylic transport membrane protein